MNLQTTSAVELQRLLNDGSLSSRELVDRCAERISDQEPSIGAFLTLSLDTAKAEAAASDERRRRGALLSPWDGIPVAVKDNICTRGLRTTCGSRMLERFVPPYDAAVVERLRTAGLPVLGKTNLDEFAMGSSTENSALQRTCNPRDTQRVPGGSSGGSAAAVAAGESPWALGSDTGGSIRQPAAFCGVVGIKPTYGTVSRYGLVAYASSLDQIGTFGRRVRDAASLLQLIAGHDARDSTSLPAETLQLGSDDPSVRGLRVGLPLEYLEHGLNAEIHQAVMDAVRRLEEAGAVVQELRLPLTDYAVETYYLIATAEASSNLARYDGVRYGYRAEADDSRGMFEMSRTEGFGDEVKLRIMLGTYALSAGYYDAYYKKAQQIRTMMRREYESAFEQVDVLLTPTSPTTAFAFGDKSTPLDMYLQDIFTVTSNLVGIPAVSLPCGEDSHKLPIGLQIMGPHFSEARLVETAEWLERQRNGGDSHDL